MRFRRITEPPRVSLPLRGGVGASHVQVSPGQWPSLLDFMCARFPRVSREAWLGRFARGLILDAKGAPLLPSAPARIGLDVRYYRELGPEPRVPFEARVLYRDAHLLIADKPHFLAVTPSGAYVQETLLARLRQQFDLACLVPLHRIDRGTAGLVAFSADPRTRSAYQALFRTHAVHKVYEALAPNLPGMEFPLTRRSRIVEAPDAFRMQEAEGTPNSETRIEVQDRWGDLTRYRLLPLTGRKHQLRVHLSALGAPIVNDPLYPQRSTEVAGDYSRPLKLLARSLAFDDPIRGGRREFESLLQL